MKTIIATMGVLGALACLAVDVRPELAKDGETFVTAALQRAIDDVSAQGGGTVALGAGTYLTGGVYLKDNVTLHLEQGATLLGSTNHVDYPAPVASKRQRAVLSAIDAKNVAVTGQGVVDGRGWASLRKDNAPNRWMVCFFYRCRDVRVEGVTLTNPASWTCYFKECDGVVARKVTISSQANFNNDGFDIDSKNVLIEDCVVDTDDDAICPKSDNPDFVPENIEVRNCRLSSNCNFIKFGTASRGGFRNCNIHHCTLVPASKSVLRDWQYKLPGVTDPVTGLAGIALEMVDGGVMENIHVHDIVMEGGMQTPILVRLGRRRVHPSGATAVLKDCVIENVVCKSTASYIASSITGVPGLRVQNLVLRNLDLTVKGGCAADEAAKPVPEVEKGYPENRMFNKLPLPAYGFYVRHADGVRFENVKLRYEGVREERQPVVQDDCTDVTFANCDFQKPTKPLPKDAILCEGAYDGHLQGVATDGEAIYWPFTHVIVKTDLKGRVLASTAQPRHQGDCCVHDGLLYVAVNRGKFNQETGAVSEVWAYDTRDLALKNKWKVPELVHGAGGMTWHDGRFYVVGGLPKTHVRNYVYAYTPDFTFVKRHVLETGYTVLGIQTAAFEQGRFLFGCYHDKEFPVRTLVCPSDLGSFEVSSESTDVGVLTLDGRLFCARTRKAGPRSWGGFLVPAKIR